MPESRSDCTDMTCSSLSAVWNVMGQHLSCNMLDIDWLAYDGDDDDDGDVDDVEMLMMLRCG